MGRYDDFFAMVAVIIMLIIGAAFIGGWCHITRLIIKALHKYLAA